MIDTISQPPRAGKSPFEVAEPITGYYAVGGQGQRLAIYPRARLVAVRQHRKTPSDNTDETRITWKRFSPGPAHRCSKDVDCQNSCRYGAVNKQWYSYGARGECKDGCAGKGADKPKCEEGACVAYRRGQPDATCTRRPIRQPD